MFGFFKRAEKTQQPVQPPQVATPVKTTRENVKINKGNTFINIQHLMDAYSGNRGLNMPVGKEVIDGVWYTLFIRTSKGEILVDKNGETILNRR